jgi:hypothetical protein
MMSGEMFVVLFAVALIPAFIAKSKGRNFVLWYIYGLALFIVALVHSLIISKSAEQKQTELKEQGYTECPFCKEPVKVGAVVCPHCRRDLPAPQILKQEDVSEDVPLKCPTCGFIAKQSDELCPRCRNLLH